MAITVLSTFRVLYYDKQNARVGGDYSIATREEAVERRDKWNEHGKAFLFREIDLGNVPICDFAPTERKRVEQVSKDADTLFKERV